MIWGVVIILAFSALLVLIVHLYQEHVDYLNRKIRDLQFEVDLTTECLDAHKEMVEDLEGYYEKWIETVNELNKANQEIYELKQLTRKLKLELLPYQKRTWKQIEESLTEGEMKYI